MESKQSVLEVSVLDAGEMSSEDLSDFGQIITARRRFFEMARIAGCFWSAVVSTYQQRSKEGQTLNWQQGVGHPKRINARGQQRLFCLV